MKQKKTGATHFGERSLELPNLFLPTKSISYESWYLQLKFETLLRLLRSKFGPLKVAEVAKVKARKNVSFFLKSSIFELYKCIIPKKNLRTY
jgi:hypothetical protein